MMGVEPSGIKIPGSENDVNDHALFEKEFRE
jgi:hypothetical protein